MFVSPSVIGKSFPLAIVAAIAFSLSSASLALQDNAPAQDIESTYVTNVLQLTFEGKRAGEGYFNADGTLMVFQSERRSDNPFFQIYLLDLTTGDIEPISPGHGKTTCAWIHPNNRQVLFSSTHDDLEARAKQKTEIEFRESGQARRYSWDYDPTYELYSFDRQTKTYQRLTHAPGYDAEGCYSPDGKHIVFASNRQAWESELTEEEKKKLEIDPAYWMEIYIMDADGSNVRQLTHAKGYDGGPFFSHDGTKICWRRFSEDGARAEIFTMNIDGSDPRQLTHMGAMSWAPFFHPSGEYLIFNTNKHGFGNFELYLVDAKGLTAPVRVTDTNGFDALASFSPDGKRLTWTSGRTPRTDSQIFIADWNHEAALEALSKSRRQSSPDQQPVADNTTQSTDAPAKAHGAEQAKQISNSVFAPTDLSAHVDYLCSPELEGRLTGSEGERKATAYVAGYFEQIGLVPDGDESNWFQYFDFPVGVEIGKGNQLAVNYEGEPPVVLDLDSDWRPLAFTSNIEIKQTTVVFAGYGIVAPAQDGQRAYDSYAGLNVENKWVMVFRFSPEEVSAEQRQHLQFYSSLRKKAFYARERGARGLIVVSGPGSKVQNQLVPLKGDFSSAGSSLAAVSVSDRVAADWFEEMDKNLADVQSQLDRGETVEGFELPSLTLSAQLDLTKTTGKGRNVLGRLQAGDQPSPTAVLIGAHIDHLGRGESGNSLASETEKGEIHFGADDNASGVAGLLEIADFLVHQKREGKLQLKHDIIFAAWSGEELGLHGSKHYVEARLIAPTPVADSGQPSSHQFVIQIEKDGAILVNGKPSTSDDLAGKLGYMGKNHPNFVIDVQIDSHAPSGARENLVNTARSFGVTQFNFNVTSSGPQQTLIAALNMDMIGRLRDKAYLQGAGSSDYWSSAIESRNVVVGLPLSVSNDTALPTDASSFYVAGVPILSAFTGSHNDYHSPRDTPDKLNYEGAAKVAQLMGLIVRSLASSDEVPNYIRQETRPQGPSRAGSRVALGTVPSYGDDVVGVLLSDVTPGGAAAKAGVEAGDIIVGLAGSEVENIYDYSTILNGLRAGEETEIIVQRDGKRLSLKLIPLARD